MRNNKLYLMLVSAMLIAIGIIIPMFSPLRVVLEPASFTLASHVAIFIAMFISPAVAVSVAAGTTLGFLLGGFPIVIVARAATHLVFATVGALVLRKRPCILEKPAQMSAFALLISVLHAASEVLVVMPFYFGGNMKAYAARGFVTSVIMLVGVGSVVHSLVDFTIARTIWAPLKKMVDGRNRTTRSVNRART